MFQFVEIQNDASHQLNTNGRKVYNGRYILKDHGSLLDTDKNFLSVIDLQNPSELLAIQFFKCKNEFENELQFL